VAHCLASAISIKLNPRKTQEFGVDLKKLNILMS